MRLLEFIRDEGGATITEIVVLVVMVLTSVGVLGAGVFCLYCLGAIVGVL